MGRPSKIAVGTLTAAALRRRRARLRATRSKFEISVFEGLPHFACCLSVQKEYKTTRRNAMHLAVTPWLNRRLPSAGPKSDGLFCKLSLLSSCLRRSDASRAPRSCVCAAQPHTHQRILLQPRIRHSLVRFEHSGELRAASQAKHPSIVSVWLGHPSASAQCVRSIGIVDQLA